MSKRMSADEMEEHDTWLGRLRERWWPDNEEDEGEEEAFGGQPDYRSSKPRRPAPTSAPTTNGNGNGNGQSPLLQVHSHRGSQINKRIPKSLADAQRAAEDLKERRPVIVNLEKADDELARRVIDFISGVTYALNGFYERVGDKVFLFTPANIIIADEDEIEPGGKGPFLDDRG